VALDDWLFIGETRRAKGLFDAELWNYSISTLGDKIGSKCVS
jgi:hypothetical protein